MVNLFVNTQRSQDEAKSFGVITDGGKGLAMQSKAKDLELVAKIVSGDQSAMKDVYETHSAALQSFVKSWLADPHEAADVVHETMLEVWRRADRFQGRSSLKSWMFSIARYKAIDKNRKGSRISYTDIEPEIVDETVTPSEALALTQEAAHIRECIATLSEAHQRVIHLAFYADMTYKEIAEIEDCPVGTVKTRVLHSKKLLMRRLKDIYKDTYSV